MLGGEDMAKKIVGGTRWWQVRGLEGIPVEWIAVRKDIEAQKRRRKAGAPPLSRSATQRNVSEAPEPSTVEGQPPEPHEYSKDMEGTPCLLYVHVSQHFVFAIYWN